VDVSEIDTEGTEERASSVRITVIIQNP